MSQLPRLCLALPLAAVFSLTAHADTIATFTLDANLYSGISTPVGSASGTITIDTTTGTITASDVLFDSNPLVLDAVGPQGSSGNFYDASITDSSGDDLDLRIPVLSLVGYSGGELCNYQPAVCFTSPSNQVATTYFSPATGGAYTESGSLAFKSEVITTTPEPSGLALLGTGLLGVVGMVRRRSA